MRPLLSSRLLLGVAVTATSLALLTACDRRPTDLPTPKVDETQRDRNTNPPMPSAPAVPVPETTPVPPASSPATPAPGGTTQ